MAMTETRHVTFRPANGKNLNSSLNASRDRRVWHIMQIISKRKKKHGRERKGANTVRQIISHRTGSLSGGYRVSVEITEWVGIVMIGNE